MVRRRLREENRHFRVERASGGHTRGRGNGSERRELATRSRARTEKGGYFRCRAHGCKGPSTLNKAPGAKLKRRTPPALRVHKAALKIRHTGERVSQNTASPLSEVRATASHPFALRFASEGRGCEGWFTTGAQALPGACTCARVFRVGYVLGPSAGFVLRKRWLPGVGWRR